MIGRQVDVSQAPEMQAEVSAAEDPISPAVLLAGSNSDHLLDSTLRTYSSVDGGATWTSTVGPGSATFPACLSDPAVGIDRTGRQYYAFVHASPCDDNGVGRLLIARRQGPLGHWGKPRAVAPLNASRLQDRPALAIDDWSSSPHANRIWISWNQFGAGAYGAPLYLSHSDDGGRSWSKPLLLEELNQESALAAAPDGSLYVADVNPDGGRVDVIRVAPDGTAGQPIGFDAGVIQNQDRYWMCGETVHPLRAMPERCLLAEPSIGVDKDGTVYLAWSGPGWDRSRDVFVRALNDKLVPIGDPFGLPDPLVPERRPRTDQFLPSLAVDPQSGDVWVCFYDTTGDPTRQHATRTCAASSDHAYTWRFVRAASVPSDQVGRRADAFAYGDYEALVASDGYAHPFWTDTRDRKTRGEEIYTTTITTPRQQRID